MRLLVGLLFAALPLFAVSFNVFAWSPWPTDQVPSTGYCVPKYGVTGDSKDYSSCLKEAAEFQNGSCTFKSYGYFSGKHEFTLSCPNGYAYFYADSLQPDDCPDGVNPDTGECSSTCPQGELASGAFVYDPAGGYMCISKGEKLCRAECGSVCVNTTGETTWGPLELTGAECSAGDPGDPGTPGGGDTGGGDTGGGDGGDTGGDGGDTGGGDSGGSGGDSGGSGGDSGGSGGDSGGSGGDSGGDTGGGDNPNQGGSDNSDLIDESGMPSGADYVGNMDSNKKGYGDALDDIDGSSGVGSIETFADESGIYGAISGVASIFSNSQCSNPKYSGSIQVEMDVCGAASKVRPFAYIMFAVMAALYCYQRINATFREV